MGSLCVLWLWAAGIGGGLLGWWLRARLEPYELHRVQMWLSERARKIDARKPDGTVDYEKNTERLRLLDEAGYLSFAPRLLVAYRRRWWRRG
jgi:hypothetical protein